MKKLCVKALCYFAFVSIVVSCDDYATSIDVDTDVDYLLSEEDFVSIDEATNVVNMFWDNSGTGFETRSAGSFSSNLHTDVILKNETPVMYVFNHDSLGFVIVGASHNYYPILAFSNDNNFDLSDMPTGLSMWVEETKDALQNSKFFDDSIKTMMNLLWRDFETGRTINSSIDRDNIQTRISYTPGEIACWNRCEELNNQYGSEGWNFAPLSSASNVFSEVGLSSYYDNLCYSANYNHSNINCSVVGWKADNTINQVGPLLNTHWHQHAPFNNLCNGHLAGCAAVAVAQIMKFYEYPNSFSYFDQTFDWSSIPDNPNSQSNQKELVWLIGNRVNMNYYEDYSWATPGDVKIGLESFGYNVNISDDNYEDVEQELFSHHRPVMMLGNRYNLEYVFGPAQYIGGHYWVCDGIRSQYSGRLLVCAEWQPYSNGQFVQNSFSPINPEAIGGTSYLYYYMSWGWRNGSSNGWFAYNRIDYNYSRTNYLISVP